jgi:hypothetical protein
MKWIPALALFTLVALVAIPGAMAQGVALRADIPFGFTVGNTALPAGEYTVSSPVSGLIRIVNDDTQAAATVAASHGNHDSGHDNKLVFSRYGDRYFLHRIFCPATTSMNVEIAAWKAEKRARTLESKLDRGEQILVATK